MELRVEVGQSEPNLITEVRQGQRDKKGVNNYAFTKCFMELGVGVGPSDLNFIIEVGQGQRDKQGVNNYAFPLCQLLLPERQAWSFLIDLQLDRT